MKRRKSKAARVREPVQVYLDSADQSLLETVAAGTGLSRAEILRRGLRRVAGDLLAERKPGASFEQLIGALGDDPSLPSDLAARHDAYLYGETSDGSVRWLERFADQAFSLTDAVSFEVMRRLRLRKAFAFDHHFDIAGFERLE